MRSKTTLILGSIALALALTSTPASANHTDFHYSPSELTSVDGAQKVYGRIHSLAADLCNKEFGRFNPKNQARNERCKRDVMQDLVGKIDHFNLEKVSLSKNRFTQKDNKSYKVTSK